MDLMKKLERVLDLLIVVLEKQLNPLTAVAATPAPAPEVKPEPKPRAKKEKPAAAPIVPPAAPSGDPLMQAESVTLPAAPAAGTTVNIPSAAVVMTEDQSLERAKDLAKLLVEAYPEKESNNRPKGFRLAMELLAKHKVARTTDLIHSQRLQFIAEGEALLPKVAA